jgi:Leucine-rich repeat (LRR) protein
MTVYWLNRCAFRAVSSGTGAFAVASALPGFQIPEDCAGPAFVDGGTYRYFAQSDDLSQWEFGSDVYTTAGGLVRSAVLDNDLGTTSPRSFSAAPQVYMGGPLAHDMVIAAATLFTPTGALSTGILLGDHDPRLRAFGATSGTGYSEIHLSGCPALERVSIVGAPNLTLVDLSDCSSLIECDISTNPLALAIDLSGCLSLPVLTASFSPLLTAADVSGCTSMTSLNIVSCALTGMDITTLTALLDCNLSDNDIASIDLSAAVNLTAFDFGQNALTTISVANSPGLLFVGLSINDLNQAAVDGVLVDLDGFGLSSGEVQLNGGTNAAPSATGLTAKASLEGRGWVVTVN